MSGDLDGSDYRIIKGDCERQVSIIEGKLVQFSGRNDGIGALLEKAMKTASRLTEIYESADIQGKRKLISSMYPENLIFDGTSHRTNRINEAIRVFNRVEAVFEEKNKGKSTMKIDLPSVVAGSRIELPTSGL